MAGLSTTESKPRGPHTDFARFLAGLQVLAWAAFAPVFAASDVERLLVREAPPHGVIFEIVEADEQALQSLLPRVREAIGRIRSRFPQTEFAVVSHGREEFALQTRYREEYSQVHGQVQALVVDAIPVHVCETHAGWYGVSAEDFPETVNVSPSGPEQIRLYQELGYELIVFD